MPDILIRGMEMPPENTFDIVYIYSDGSIAIPTWGKGVAKVDNLQAVELPPHGDLVDATQYRDEFMDGVYNMCSDDSDNNRANAIIDLYDCSPVVVPAERREG